MSASFFYAVVADDGECMSTHPSYAPRAALVGLGCAERDEADATDFPRRMRLERWYYVAGDVVRRQLVRGMQEAA